HGFDGVLRRLRQTRRVMERMMLKVGRQARDTFGPPGVIIEISDTVLPPVFTAPDPIITTQKKRLHVAPQRHSFEHAATESLRLVIEADHGVGKAPAVGPA